MVGSSYAVSLAFVVVVVRVVAVVSVLVIVAAVIVLAVVAIAVSLAGVVGAHLVSRRHSRNASGLSITRVVAGVVV